MTSGARNFSQTARKAVALLALVFAFLLWQVPARASGLTDEQKINAYYTLITMKISGGAYEEALENIDKCLELAGENHALSADLWLKKGAVYAMMPDYGKALSALQEALERDESLAEAHLVTAQILFEQKDLAAALEHMRKYLALKPEDTDMYSLLAEMHFALGQYRDAGDAYTVYIDAQDTVDPAALYMRGVSFLQDGRYQEAVADFTLTLDSPQHGQNARYNRAVANMQLGRMEEAEADLTYLADAGAQIAGLSFNRGIVRMSRGDKEGAIADFDVSIDNGEQRQDALLNRAACLLQLERFEEAERDYTLYIEDSGEKDIGVYYRGITRLSLGKYDGAVEDFSLFLHDVVPGASPEALGDLPAWARNYRAAAHMGAGHFEEAIADLTENIEKGLLPAVSYYNRSLCYQQLGKTKLAEEDLTKSLEFDERAASQEGYVEPTATAGPAKTKD